jgi:DNA-binding MarR family transcriptional regulator
MTEAPSHDGLDLESQVCFALSIAARGVVAAYKPLLEPLGLTHPQYLVMVALWQHGASTVGDLGARLVLDSGTLSPLLHRLESRGLVRRGRSPEDQRRVLVTVTEEGRQVRALAGQVHAGVVRQLGLGTGELEQLQRALAHVIVTTGADG